MYYQPPLEDIRFCLETFDYDQNVQSMERFQDFDLETSMGLIEAYSEFCMDVLAPLNSKGDHEGVKFNPEDSSVALPDGFKEAYAQFCENGFNGMAMEPEYGGVGAPFVVSNAAQELSLIHI